MGRASRNEISLDDLQVSRQHASFHWENDTLVLSDLNSINGTLINGRRLNGSATLEVGDRIQIGSTSIEIEGYPEVIPPGQKKLDELALRPESTISLPPESRTDAALHSLIARVREIAPDHEVLPVVHAQERLGVIHEVGRALLSPHTLDEVLREIVFLVLEVVPAERVFLFLKASGDGELACKVACYRRADGTTDVGQITISRSIVDEVVNHERPVLSCDAQCDERFLKKQSIISSGVRSIMAVPLVVAGRATGMLYADSRQGKACFSEEDLGLMATVASVVDIKIENALLMEQRLENERMRQQMENARQIQVRLLPAEAPAPAGYDLAGRSVPCFEVGGDYYDFIPLEGGKIGIVVGDVSGKGLDAALLVSCLHACVRSQARISASPAEKIAAVNRYVFENTPENRFATLIYGELDPTGHTFEYINAGHNPALWVRADGSMKILESSGIPVGIMEHSSYNQARLDLEPGSQLLIYSDGAVEAEKKDGEEFGMERLREAVLGCRRHDALQLITVIGETIASFSDPGKPCDDITLVALKRLP